METRRIDDEDVRKALLARAGLQLPAAVTVYSVFGSARTGAGLFGPEREDVLRSEVATVRVEIDPTVPPAYAAMILREIADTVGGSPDRKRAGDARKEAA